MIFANEPIKRHEIESEPAEKEGEDDAMPFLVERPDAPRLVLVFGSTKLHKISPFFDCSMIVV